jgi:hypothetical protein
MRAVSPVAKKMTIASARMAASSHVHVRAITANQCCLLSWTTSSPRLRRLRA